MATPVQINLTPEQLALAEAEAARRQQVNSERGLLGRNNAPAGGEKALSLHRLGAVGEVAVAVHLGLEAHLFSEQEARRGSTDLPGGIEVKTRSRHWHDLIVQKDEVPTKKLVLVTAEGSSIRIQGWCLAADVMQPKFWADPARGRPAYFVPKSHLKPVESLMEV